MALITLKQNREAIIQLLKDNSTTIGIPEKNITKGKVGTMPQVSPFINVFYENITIDKYEATATTGKATFDVFIGIKSTNEDALDDAIETAQIVAKVIMDNSNCFDLTYGIDSIANNGIVSFVSFSLRYKNATT